MKITKCQNVFDHWSGTGGVLGRIGCPVPKTMIIAVLIIVFLASGCNTPLTSGKNAAAVQGVEQSEKTDQVSHTDQPVLPEGLTEIDLKAQIDLELKPNEAGKIMVLMYHDIGNVEKEWVRTPENFLKDLQTLYNEGYRPISLKDYAAGQISTAQGMTPVVITFDDGKLNNFAYLANGLIDPQSAVGMLLAFREKHQDFPLEATFYIYGKRPFRQKDLVEKKLNFLIGQGMDVGNHTADHLSFKEVNAAVIQKQIGLEAQYLQAIIKKADYQIDSLSLPYGERTKNQAVDKYLAAGSYRAISYMNKAIVNVGWQPAYSPFDSRFDPFDIPRVRASEMKVDQVGLYDYLAYFDKHPEERFRSDGQVDVITFPAGKREFIKLTGEKEIYVY